MQKNFRGVIVASVTPFSADRSVDAGAVRALMHYYAENGLCGAFLCSSSGEYYAMTDAQRDAMKKYVRMVLDACRHRWSFGQKLVYRWIECLYL